MRDESVGLLDAIDAYNLAHEGDSDDAEIDAAFAMQDASMFVAEGRCGRS